MFKKRFFLAMAFALLSFAGTMNASNTWQSIFTQQNMLPAWNFFQCTGGGNETFSNLGSSASSYAVRNWTGNNGVTWTANDARTDLDLNGDAIGLRTSTLKNTSTVSGGVGTLTFNYKRVFSGNSTLKVFVNGVQYGSDVTVSSETTSVFSQVINVSGNVVIEIRNSGNRTIVDDVAWTCFENVVAGPELQLANASNVNAECGSLTVDFGSNSFGAYTDAIFYVKNTGTTNLDVTALTLSNTDDFEVISPSGAFTVAPSGSAIVLVRFEAATAGAKSGTLTVVNNDTNEAACVVNLEGVALAPCAAPVVDNPEVALDNVTAATADVTVSGVTADSYLVILSQTPPLTAAPVDGTNYTVGTAIGGGTVAYNGSAAAFTLSGLTENTEYAIYVFPYNNTDCSEGPVYLKTSIDSDFITPVAPCIGGNETFTNIPASSTAYLTRNWTGNNGISWTATEARTDQTLNGKAIAIRTGSVTNTTPVTGGIDTLSFNYKRVFSGESTLKVFVNGVQYGGDITVSLDTPSSFSQAIEVSGPVTIEIENSGNRTVIDDITWNCYQTPERPELQLADENLENKACGNFTIDFGSVALATNTDKVFTIKNLGSLDLDIASITVNDTVNYSIVAPAPSVVGALSSEEVTVRFNSAAAGTFPAVLTIASNDADEATCTIDLTAIALENCVAPEIVTGDVVVSNETSSSADVDVTGITADGYLVLISNGAAFTAPDNGTVYNIGDTVGAATVAYVGTDASFTIEELTAETEYLIAIYAYNNTDCIGGPAYADGIETEIVTIAAPCIGGSETFANIGTAASSYATRNWTGDNGITWTATDARTDQTLNGKAIAVRTGFVSNTTAATGGIGTLTFNYKRVFTGNSTLKVFVNGVQVGSDITVSADTPTLFSEVVNVTGPVTVRIENSLGRTIIDDIAWDCYSGAARQAAPAAPVKSFGSLDNSVKVYPNPNNGQFQVALTDGAENAAVEVYNTLGKVVFSKNVANGEVINIGNADKGIYMVVVKSAASASSHKIIVN